MNSFFMIEFKYLGQSHFANVFEHGTSPSFYDVHLINIYPSAAHKIILKRTDKGIVVEDPSRPAHQDFIDAIITQIEEHLAKV